MTRDLTRTRMTTACGILLAMGCATAAFGASHSDAPLIKQDPLANLTDVYAFIGTKYDDPATQVLNIIAHVRPFSEPGDGPHYEKFADDARYSLHITNPATGETGIRYDFSFSAPNANIKNPNTILSYGLGTEAGPIMTINDARQNFVQTYNVTRTVTGGSTSTVASGVFCAPPNVGNNVTPLYNDAQGRAVSGAIDAASLDSYTAQAVTTLPSGEVVFAGPRDDGFYADVPGVFDLLNVRILDRDNDLTDGLGQDSQGVDGFKGFNTLAFAIQVPLADLAGVSGPYTSAFFGNLTGVGVYASVSRPQFRELSADGNDISTGPWVQVNRMGNPLFNEVLVALQDKDRFNRSSPDTGDADFATYAQNPEVAFLINFVYGTSFAESGRADLVNIFIPEVLRVCTTTGPVPLAGSTAFNRLGFIGGDTTGGVSSAWPNGRRVGDDVVDIALTAVASGPAYTTITVVGDNVASNDIAYNRVFPYSATPHAGARNRKDSGFIPGDLNDNDQIEVGDLNIFLFNWTLQNMMP